MICGMCEQQFKSDEALERHLEACGENVSLSGAQGSPPLRSIEKHRFLLAYGREAYENRYGVAESAIREEK